MASAKKQRFKVRLRQANPGGEAAYFCVPFDTEKVFGTRARVPVRGTVNGFPFRSSIFPMGGPRHLMALNKEIRAGAKVKIGDTVDVVLERDDAPRTVILPAELEKALAANRAAKQAFDKRSYTHRKEFARWITEAKQPDTRLRRLEKTIHMLLSGRHL